MTSRRRTIRPRSPRCAPSPGSPTVQVLAHCFGATTFSMAMLAGLEGVRSAVISQIATDYVVPWFPQRMLAYLRTPALFDAHGHRCGRCAGDDRRRASGARARLGAAIHRAGAARRAYARRHLEPHHRALRPALSARPAQRRHGRVGARRDVRRGQHRCLQAAGAVCARAAACSIATARTSTLPHLDRLALPITFIHGAKNACFRPKSTARTLVAAVAGQRPPALRAPRHSRLRPHRLHLRQERRSRRLPLDHRATSTRRRSSEGRAVSGAWRSARGARPS